MAHDHSSHDSDLGAAYKGLILGALFIGAILYSIVLLTNKHFAGEKAEKATGSIPVVQPLVG